eukprot:COSAG01_NODE_10_length_42970_cov_93.010007_53_plen_392_part_00
MAAPATAAAAARRATAVVPRVARLGATLAGRRVAPTSSSLESTKAALAAGAHVYLNFMSLQQQDMKQQLRDWPWSMRRSTIGGEERRRIYRLVAAARYAHFRDLQLQHPHVSLVPSRDISAAWAADLLRPTQYEQLSNKDPMRTAPLARRFAEMGLPASGGERVPLEGMEWLFHQQHRLLQSGTLFQQDKAQRWTWCWKSASHGLAYSSVACVAAVAVLGTPFIMAPLAIYHAIAGFVMRKGVCASPLSPLGLSVAAFDSTGTEVLSSEDRKEALQQWKAAYDTTAKLWRHSYPPLKRWNTTYTRTSYRPAHWHVTEDPHYRRGHGFTEADHRLADAMASQDRFNSRILALGPGVVNDVWIANAVERYCEFLELARRCADVCNKTVILLAF